MTTFLLISSIAINIVLIVAHKRLNNNCEKTAAHLARSEDSYNSLYATYSDVTRHNTKLMAENFELRKEIDRMKSIARSSLEIPMSKRI